MLEFYRIIQSISNPAWDNLFIIVSFLGSEPAYIVLLATIFWNIDKRFGFRLGILFLTSMTLNSFLKDFLQTFRPIGQPGIRSIYVESATGYSFPSGHSQGAATFYLYLASQWKKRLIILFSLIMIITIGFSRLYLGLHWPADIFGGYFIGILAVVLFLLLDKTLFKLPFSLRIKILISLLFPLSFSLVYHSDQGLQLIGFTMGYASGYFLEDHYIDYMEKTSIYLSIYKTVMGLGVLGIWVVVWEPLTVANRFFNLPVYLLAGIWTSFFAPIWFRTCGWEGIRKNALIKCNKQ
ncbi:MAG: phosphatase PAP2 family protein [Desulfitobacterium hafniense]|nr:phosphatase PAP2 family protein [Desulfitobacterium hafniense]